MSGQNSQKDTGQVRIRSNVTDSCNAWHLVPGELAAELNPGHQLTAQQREEANLYTPCCICHRSLAQIEEEGCNRCRAMGHETLTQEEARRNKLARTRSMGNIFGSNAGSNGD